MERNWLKARGNMAETKDDDTMVQITRMTKKIKPALNGCHVQISYYCGEGKAAQEVHDPDGNVVETSAVIPDGTVKEYYTDGILREATLF